MRRRRRSLCRCRNPHRKGPDKRRRRRTRTGSMPPGPGIDALKERTLAIGRQGRRDARLQQARSPQRHGQQTRIKPRPVEGMRHCADQPASGAPRQPRVGVQSNDVADAGRHCRCSARRLTKKWCPRHRATSDSIHEAFHVCVPSRSNCARCHSNSAGGGKGENPLASIWGRVHGGDSVARYRRRSRPTVRRLPAYFLARASVQSESSAKPRSPFGFAR